MAEDVKKDEQKPKQKLPLKTILVILGILLLEGATIGIVMVVRGGPKPAEATDPIGASEQNIEKEMAEVSIAKDFTVDNYVAGRSRIIVTLEVTAKVQKANLDNLQARVTEHETEIRDTIRSLISSSQPDQLQDPKLQVIKRDILVGIEKIVGEGLIEKILVPNWQSFRQE